MTETAGSRVASQRVAEELRERILSGRLRPGTRIKQDELAEELATSRIPVREALRILETRGLVEVRSNSGAWVGQMDLHDLSMSYQIRERIEPLLLADSMPRLGDDDVAELRALQARIEANDDLETFMVLDRELHWRTYAGHRTPQLAGMVERLWDTTQHYRREFVRLSGGSKLLGDELRAQAPDRGHRASRHLDSRGHPRPPHPAHQGRAESAPRAVPESLASRPGRSVGYSSPRLRHTGAREGPPTGKHAGQRLFSVWQVQDSNLRRNTPTDLQSAPIGRSGNLPVLTRIGARRNDTKEYNSPTR